MTDPQQIGPYKVLQRLGRGGMGAVYLCQHRDLGFRRAIKVLHTDGSESALDRFKKEAQVQAELDHPHLLKIEHSDLDQKGRAYVVMAYVGDDEGPMDLDRYLKDHGGKLDSRTTARLVGQILDGLSYAHGEGIIHRDLKPANILIEQNASGPMARIADFGLVRIVGEAAFRDRIFTSISQSLSLGSAPTIPGALAGDVDLKNGPEPSIGSSPTIDGHVGPEKHEHGGSQADTSTQALIGTWSYMAPEQKKPGTTVDHRTDLYAVGLMAYRMLMGKLPEGIPLLPGQVDPAMAVWDAWIRRALEADSATRFQSAKEAREGLRAIAGRPATRTAKRIGIMTLVVLAAVAGIWAVPWFGSGPPRHDLNRPGVSDQVGTNEALLDTEDTQETVAPPDTRPGPPPASDLNKLAEAVDLLEQTKLTYPEHAVIGERWEEAESYVKTAETERAAGEWSAAANAYEEAIKVFGKAKALDRAAEGAEDARKSYDERITGVDWFEHPVVNAGRAEADRQAAQAQRSWDAGDFDDASSAWGQAIELALSAIEKSARAPAAAAAREQWQRQLESLSATLLVDIAEELQELRREANDTAGVFENGDFAAARAQWEGHTSDLGELLARHEREKSDAENARAAWEEARQKLPERPHDGQEVWNALNRADQASEEAEAAFLSGDFTAARAEWKQAAKSARAARAAHQAAVRALLREAKANDNKANCRTALDKLEELLTLESGHPEATRLKRKIEGFCVPELREGRLFIKVHTALTGCQRGKWKAGIEYIALYVDNELKAQEGGSFQRTFDLAEGQHTVRIEARAWADTEYQGGKKTMEQGDELTVRLGIKTIVEVNVVCSKEERDPILQVSVVEKPL